MRTLFCTTCGWRLDGEVGIDPYCPCCQSRLNLLRGAKEEIDKYLGEKYPEFRKKKELCSFCGGTGFKMITTYEGNSEFHILSSNPQKCQMCNRESKRDKER